MVVARRGSCLRQDDNGGGQDDNGGRQNDNGGRQDDNGRGQNDGQDRRLSSRRPHDCHPADPTTVIPPTPRLLS